MQEKLTIERWSKGPKSQKPDSNEDINLVRAYCRFHGEVKWNEISVELFENPNVIGRPSQLAVKSYGSGDETNEECANRHLACLDYGISPLESLASFLSAFCGKRVDLGDQIQNSGHLYLIAKAEPEHPYQVSLKDYSLVDFTNGLRELEGKSSVERKSLSFASRLYRKALRTIGADAELSYVLLVGAVEALARSNESENRGALAKFKTFLFSSIDDQRLRNSMPGEFGKAIQLDKVAERTYELRSNYVHEGVPFGQHIIDLHDKKSFQHGIPPYSAPLAPKGNSEKRESLTIESPEMFDLSEPRPYDPNPCLTWHGLERISRMHILRIWGIADPDNGRDPR